MTACTVTPRAYVWTTVLSLGCALATRGDERLLYDFGKDFDIAKVEARDVRVSLSTGVAAPALRLAVGHHQEWPGITLPAPAGHWDLSAFAKLQINVTNVGTNRATVCCRVDNPGADGVSHCITRTLELEPGARGVLEAPLLRAAVASGISFFGMRGNPPGFGDQGGIDTANITQLLVFVPKPKEDHLIEIDSVRATGAYQASPWTRLTAAEFFPMIDEYGQFVHKDWPGKVRDEADLRNRRTAEAAELQAQPGPNGWNRFGGWAGGPQLEATGCFRTAKHEGRWWLVDPEGRLFWSHGIDCVGTGNATTPVTDRRNWFRGLPAPESPLARFYGQGSWAPHNYYEGKTYETFNFTAANLLRKYGENWEADFAQLTHRRLRSWGMNTIANWSTEAIYLQRQTPYTATIHFGGRNLEGSEGYWGKFRDVFDAGFAVALRESLGRHKERSANDPWCIGYFIDNEIGWGDDTSLAVATLVSPAGQPAKQVFVADLKAKYATIAALNAAWGSQHATWEALLESRQAPDLAKARADLTAFYSKTADLYFRTCRDELKAIAPRALYLGCRFAWVNELAARAAVPYCDVISYNFYQRSVADVRLPEGVDKPILVGEFHFGALDRGLFHTGLVPLPDQESRAAAYRDYVTGALRNPLIVGTHWFQFGDQATTGRGDGENYQIGFLDVCDTPYAETIAAARQVGYGLYATRSAP
jgi:hypothetical protein